MKVYDWTIQGNTASEVLCYALILSFSENGKKYSGGMGYIAKRLNMTTKTVSTALNKLVAKGLLKKDYIERDKVKYCVYWASDSLVADSCTEKITIGGTEKIIIPHGKNLPTTTEKITIRGTEKNSHNNKDNNKEYKDNNKYNKESNDSSIATAKRKASIDYEEFKEFFNITMTQAGAVIPKIKDVTPKRKGMINARVKEYGMEAVREVVKKAAASIFMNGGGGRAWKATFDWIFSPNNFVKILENNYNDNKPNNNGRADIGLAGQTANERVETLQERIRRENDDFLNGEGEDRGLSESIF